MRAYIVKYEVWRISTVRVTFLSTTLKSQWLSSLQFELSQALAQSLLVKEIDQAHLETGRTICEELWPFIRELPDNISHVRNKLLSDIPNSSPPGLPNTSKKSANNSDSKKLALGENKPALEPAGKFLGQLADEERLYQGLYLKQCRLAGLDPEVLLGPIAVPPHAQPLVTAMRHWCREGSLREGIEAIVAAELAASGFARVVLDSFEGYFSANEACFGKEKVEEGLTWLRFHAKPNVRHAIWMKKMLDAVGESSPLDQSKNLPLPVSDIVNALSVLWRCPIITLNEEISI